MKLPIWIFIGFLLTIISCDKEDRSIITSVFTEEIVFSSGERAILTGRILSGDILDVSDHGFHISKTESFDNLLTISLGTRAVPGRFVGETSELNIEDNYFVRSFIINEGNEVLGNVLEFSTLKPRVLSFAPITGVRNTKITIEGISITKDAFVLWNDEKITPTSIIEESFIEFNVPTIGDISSAGIKVVSQGDTLVLTGRFEYIIGEWGDAGSIVDPFKNNNHIYFEDANNFYYGLGNSLETNGPSNLIYRLNKENLDRDQVLHNGTPVEGSFYTHNGFFGSGSRLFVKNQDPTLALINEFYSLDGDETIQLANIPFSLYKAVAFAHNDHIYVYGGEDGARNRNTQIFRYNIANDFWDFFGESPYGPLNEYPSFVDGENNYFITEQGVMHRHNVVTDVWSIMAQYPDNVKEDGISISYKGKIYVGLQDVSRRVFEYDTQFDTWKKITSNSDIDPSLTLGVWQDDDKITVMRSNFGSGEERFFWTLDPTAF